MARRGPGGTLFSTPPGPPAWARASRRCRRAAARTAARWAVEEVQQTAGSHGSCSLGVPHKTAAWEPCKHPLPTAVKESMGSRVVTEGSRGREGHRANRACDSGLCKKDL